LNLEIKAKDLQISTYDQKTLDMENDKNDTIDYYEKEIEEITLKAKTELDFMQQESQVKKTELNQLLEFKTKKVNIIIQTV